MKWTSRKTTLSRFSPDRFLQLRSIPSFHGLSLGSPYRLFAVLIAYMFQHSACSLRATAAAPVIELIDVHGVRALLATEGHATSGRPIDRVHDAENTLSPFPRGVIAVTLRLPWFRKEETHRTIPGNLGDAETCRRREIRHGPFSTESGVMQASGWPGCWAESSWK
jgi:hypothetical protein